MEKQSVKRITNDMYETYYGNQICVLKDDYGYWVLDTNIGFESQVFKTKSEAVNKFKSHLKQYYKTIREWSN